MDGSQASSNAPPPFLTKTYDMVDDPVTNSLVSWSQSGCSFIVWNQPEFAKDLLPKYFKHSNFSSFVRQLNTYGFRKIDPDQWEFANEEFIRGQRHLLTNIQRRKPVHSHSVQNQGSSTVPLSDTERHEFEEEIIRLNQDKSLLQLELQRYERENHGLKFQIQSVGERLQNMEHRQMQLMAFLAQLVQKPGFASIFMEQSEIHNKKRRLMEPNHAYYTSNMEQNLNLAPITDMKLFEKLELSFNFWEKYMFDVSEATGEKLNDSGISFRHCPFTITELDTSSEDTDMIAHKSCSPSLHLPSPHSRDLCSSPEVAGSMDHVDSPATYTGPKSSGIDVNMNPGCITEVDSLRELGEGKSRALPTGENDLFWEQFLTETPVPSDTHELLSERTTTNGGNGGKSDSMPGEHERYWWNDNKVNNLTERMEHLSPAERT